ncbi:trimethylamine methyltransferase family protein [Halarsenatibacter silvermanii]|uniref:Methyltransferase n=1 Tax=Halarsenatibacter silvermanii TaxID=321763 RepID=A0A1G9I3L2_9FIRM|nr:trimethylamine methyltransferase family protein [Halarsenatibacter silvermanii]SDL19672.1 trimethylamine:corrinoid methyltransferase [Halarsenatibacter silvermanii]
MFKRKLGNQDIFTPGEEDALHEATLRVLEESGVEIVSSRAREHFQRAGIEVDGNRVHPGQDDLEKFLAKAPESFEIKARNEANNIRVGGNNTVFVPGYGAPFVMDYEGVRRNSTFADYRNFTKLTQCSDNLDVVGGVLVEPNDVPDRIRHARMFSAAIKLSDKCFMGSSMGRKKARETLDMAAILFGSKKYVADNVVLITLINANSPLQLDVRMTDALEVYAENGQALCLASMSMSGTTAPATIPATLVQQNAEVLTGILLAQIINPGCPVIYGSASSLLDLRGADMALGSPETAKMFNGTAQLARRYDLPVRGGGALTDSLFPDAQGGYEAMMNIFSAIKSGFNFMLHSAGLLENYMAMSYEKFVIDDEILGMIGNYASGLEVNEDTIAEEVINEVGPGGNYITHDHTFSHMEDLRTPNLSSRRKYSSEKDQPIARERAYQKRQEILEDFEAPDLPAGIVEELKNYINDLESRSGI